MPRASDMIAQGYAPGPAIPDGYDGGAAGPGAALISNVAFMPPGLEGLYKDPFSYQVIFNVIANGATQTQSVPIGNDAFFVNVRRMVEIWDSATGNTTRVDPVAANMLVTIQDTSSGKNEMDQAAPVANLFGTGEQPFVYLYRAKLYLPGGNIQVQLTNGSGASQRVRFTFEGFKVYRVPDRLPTM